LVRKLLLGVLRLRQPAHANLLRSLNPPGEATNLLKPIIVLVLLCSTLAAQTVPHNTGIAHTEQVDLAYETFGAKGTALPIIAVNGGPGLSHAYMMQNDLWQRVGKNRFVVLYDQRGTGGSKHMQAGISQSGVSQTMDSQVADLDAVRQTLGLEKFAAGRLLRRTCRHGLCRRASSTCCQADTLRLSWSFMA
jgi:hypothetical protein